MQIKTVLNRVHKIKGFVYENVRMTDTRIEVSIRPRRGCRPICSGCGRPGPGYDTLGARCFHFVPLWAIAVILVYAMRRVECPRCGVTVEQVPWGDGKRQLTRAYAVFLAAWARRLSWKEVASIFHTSWEKVYRSVAWVVEYGLAHRNLDGITAIGVDEVQFQKGHRSSSLCSPSPPPLPEPHCSPGRRERDRSGRTRVTGSPRRGPGTPHTRKD